jgi:hypothetical protein
LPSLCIAVKMSKPKPFPALCAQLWAFSQPILCKTCDSLAQLWWSCRRRVCEICGDSQESSEIVKRHLSQIFGQHFEQDHHSIQMADHFAFHNEHLFVHLWTFSTIVLEFLHSLRFGHKLLCIIHNGFPQYSRF